MGHDIVIPSTPARNSIPLREILPSRSFARPEASRSDVLALMNTAFGGASVALKDYRLVRALRSSLMDWAYDELDHPRSTFYAYVTQPSERQFVLLAKPIPRTLLHPDQLPQNLRHYQPVLLLRTAVGHPHRIEFVGVELAHRNHMGPRLFSEQFRPKMEVEQLWSLIQHGQTL